MVSNMQMWVSLFMTSLSCCRALALGLGQTVRGPDQPAFEQHEANVSVATAGRLCVDGDGGTTDDMPGSTRRLDGHKQRGNIHHQAPAQPTATGAATHFMLRMLLGCIVGADCCFIHSPSTITNISSPLLAMQDSI